MKLTTKSEYALLALIYIARNAKADFIKIEAICEKYDISKKYLEQIFGLLRSARLIKTKTGANGGYQLAKPAKEISVAAIVRLMDGALAPTGSVSKYYYSETPIHQEKKILKVMKDIRDYIARTLENLSLAELL
jgi:Rrf2 family transcriptional regulator, cysteine metabolism repressor